MLFFVLYCGNLQSTIINISILIDNKAFIVMQINLKYNNNVTSKARLIR